MRKATYLAVLVLAVAASMPVVAEEQAAVMAPLAARSLLLDVAASGDRLIVVGERGHILLSTDAGNSWRQVPAPTQALLTAVAMRGDRLAWAVGHDAVILHSEDGGESWAIVYRDSETGEPLFDVHFLDEAHGFAVGAYGLFLESFDGGRSWEPRSVLDDDNHLHHIAQSSSGRLTIAGERGLLLASDDGGVTWRELPSPYKGSLFASLPLSGTQHLLFGLRGHAFLSTDNEGSWQASVTGVDVMLTDACQLPDGWIVVSALGGALLSSPDGGRTFVADQERARLGLAALACLPDGSLVTVGERGVQKLTADEVSATFAKGGKR